MNNFTLMDEKALANYEQEAPHYLPVTHNEVFKKSKYIKSSRDSFCYQSTDKRNEALITCVGDILCEEKLYKTHKSYGGFYFDDIFQFVRPFFKTSDLVIGNLETMICKNAPYTGEQYKVDGKFHNNAPIEFLQSVKRAGIDFLMLANNHNCDCGVNGAFETLKNIEKNGFMYTGLFTGKEKKRFSIVDVNGIKIGLLSYSTWYNRNQERLTELGRKRIINEYDPKKITKDIYDAKAEGAEFILVYIHWGTDAEYKSVQSKSMINMAQQIADCGADYIVGSHTHSVQPHDLLCSKDGRIVPCVFSMGNFVTSEIAHISHETLILSIKLKKQGERVVVAEEKAIPCYIPNKEFGVSYPIIPEFTKGESEKVFEGIKGFFANTKKIVGESLDKNILHTFLSKENICRILGVPMTGGNEHYSYLNFAMDTHKDGIAIISDITSNSKYKTNPANYKKLAKTAMDKGAKLLISTEQIGDYPCLVTDDVFEAYTKIATEYRKLFSIPAIGITGSIGKTTTTEIVYAMLNSKYNCHRNTGSANNVRYSGTVIQQLKKEHQIYVQETMEGPPFGVASTISKMLLPNIGIVTVVGTSHMDIFGSQERILESCLGIQDGMKEDGLLILNGDDPFQKNAVTNKKTVYYGIENENADYRAVNIHGRGRSLQFDIVYSEGTVTAEINCFGKHNVLNALAAFACGKQVGMTDAEIIIGLKKYTTNGIRQNLVKYSGYSIYLDCYNASPESMKSAFDTFSMIEVPKGGRKIAVLADIKEVESVAEKIHSSVGEMLAKSCIDVAICYGKHSKIIADTAKVNCNIPVFYTNNANELQELIKQNVTRKDVTLYKGSHSMELEYIVDLVYGTWLHDEFERYEFKTHLFEDLDLQYRVYEKYAVVLKKRSLSEDLVIPEEIEGKPVIGIGESAFSGAEKLKKIVFPSTLRNIRYCSFYKANNIEEIVIPSCVDIIYNSGFSTCEKLKTVIIAEGCSHLGYRVFGNCKNLTFIYIPSTVEQIGNEAFINCKKLTIHGVKGSYAERYANAQGIPFKEDVCPCGESNTTSKPAIRALSALLFNCKTKLPIYENYAYEKISPASLTKIMTALLVFEAIERKELSFEETITAPLDLWSKLYKYGSTAEIKAGEILTVKQLLQCLLVASANEASIILAEKVFGSVQKFVEQMNITAEKLGCKSTHFVNPHGVESANHYSTAYDLALITAAALKYDEFLEICDMPNVVIPATNLSPEKVLDSTNALISEKKHKGYLNSNAHGIKTGTTSKAGHCLISSTVKDGVRIISVICGAQVYTVNGKEVRMQFSETTRLLQWGLEHLNS